ncbi:MAG: hypothetical protein ACOZQL_20760 [Myxococcota bacterium]
MGLVALAVSLGAMLFFVAGFAFARFAATARPSVVATPPPTSTPAPPAELLAALEEKGLALEGAQRQHAEVSAELASARRELEELRRRQEASATDLADARAAAQRAEGALATRVASLEQKLAKARAAPPPAPRPPPAPSFTEAELARTKDALEHACEEIAQLRLAHQRAERAEGAKRALERELQFLRSTQTAAAASSAPLKTMTVQVPSLTNAHLSELVERVCREGQYLAVAVADEQGLPAAGVGERVDELAAFTSLLLTLSAQAARYFPMHDFGHATLSDANGVTIEARPVPGPHGLVMMTLGASQESR